MADEISQSKYTNVIDLTSEAQKERRRDKVGSELHEPDPSLDEMTVDELSGHMEQAVHAAGWTELMDVQRKAIPYTLDGRDLIVQSQTGSGKTGAFLLPLFDLVNPDKEEQQILILTPTRELARQIHEEFEQMKIATPRTNRMEAVLIYGGVGYQPQIDGLKKGAQVVIGTPGRILDHIKKDNFDASTLRMLVLDEADEMLSMGFYPDMKDIVEHVPGERVSYMYSATMPPKVRSVAREFLDDPGFLSLSTDKVSVEENEYRYYLVNPMDKDRVMAQLLEIEEPESALIFANTKREVSYLNKFLSNKGYDIDEMSGDLSQRDREEALDRLREGTLRLLVATDVAARGIDVSDLSHVFIYDVPQDHEYIIHRSGRTARAGEEGTTIVLSTHEDEYELKRMANTYDIELEKAELPKDPHSEARELLQERYASAEPPTNGEEPAVEDFIPLVKELSEDQPELLASVITELYARAKQEEESE
ncbi:DEAD/DEAH box helicase [Salinibacter grassmerensis]|uniref:DEAD/DEAH box helicase n=1 Tax=Salinibacter grassmerensis TaxID=3040353 RepID=UPI0021E8006E|nr:DEAD/DEAH box helicase [Salinibacter grassmerensis]